MQVRFWGTRGSIASPGPQTAIFGGNTSCVQIVTNDGTQIVLDCGTGARALGQHLITEYGSSLRIHLLIGHTHWDHIQGFPFFVPAFLPTTELNVFAPRGFQHNLEDTLAGQMQHAYFPMRLRELHSHMRFTELEEGFFRIGEVLVETQHLNHTAPTIAYRISADGATVAYTTDHEPFWKPGAYNFLHPGDQRHVEFLKDADLVIHDAQYLESEYAAKVGWGHSTVEYATDVAVAAGVSRLALFHHDPSRDDNAMASIEAVAQKRIMELGASTEAFAAAEGMVLTVQGTRTIHEGVRPAASIHRPIAGRSVLVIGMDERESTLIEQEMREDHLVLMRAHNVRAALVRARDMPPDLVIVNVNDGAAGDLVRQLRTELPANVPVLVIADDIEPIVGLIGENGSSTDLIPNPFSPPMLRSRVRAWLGRTSGGPVLHREGAADVVPTAQELAPAELYRDVLAGVPMFASLTPDELDLLSERATERRFDVGEIMIRQSERTDELLVMLSGRARVIEVPDDPAATEIGLGEMSAGDVVGELAVLTAMPRSASVVAVDAVRCLSISGDAFLTLLRTSPGLSGSLAQVLAGRIYETDQRVSRFAPDALTGLLSRRTFLDHYERFAARARRHEGGVMLLFLDVVNLNSVNDTAGYLVGDDVLRTVASALKDSVRKEDLVSRWGGDEFVVLPMDSRDIGVDVIIERLHHKLDELRTQRGFKRPIRCAYGVATSELAPESPDELIRMADADLQWRRLRS